MSWALAEKLKERFPEVELFPRPQDQEREQANRRTGEQGTGEQGTDSAPREQAPAQPEGAPGPTPPTPPKRPAHDAGPTFLTPGVFVPREKLLEVCRVLATDAEFDLTYLSFVSGIDRPEAQEIEVLYHAYSLQTRDDLALKVRIPRDHAAIPSVTGIWDGANWHEREAFDLLGITFEGHPDLRRIMMTDDWIGHPLRKDYVYEDPAWLTEVAKQRQQEVEGFGLGERA